MKNYNIAPVLKWAGGKRQLISEIEKRLPSKINRYFEPFLGGGALCMHLQFNTSFINDTSEELINVYNQIKENPIELMETLDRLEHEHSQGGKEYYLSIRAMDRAENFHKVDKIFKASRTIYLNKTCFNGLYRVNKKGYFNVPFNNKLTVKTYDKENILNLNKYFNENNVQITCGDFESTCTKAKKGDFIFLDPPYDLLKSDTFDNYTKEGFGVEGQKRLSEVFKILDKKGCYIMLTNHNTPLINELYKDYKIDVVNVKRMINSNAKKRTGEETIICNY